MRNTCSIIKIETEDGKNFFQKIQELKTKLKLDGNGEKTRKYNFLSKKEIDENSFLKDFLNFMKDSEDGELSEMFNCFELKKVFIGNFGRKTGFVTRPIKEKLFRFVLHFGDPEIYYLDSIKNRDSPLVLTNGSVFLISPQESETTSLTVYEDPIRFIYDSEIQKQISKIRAKNYSRLTLVYDYEYHVPESYLEEDDKNLEKEEN
jgi:hypothetical protein